MALEFDSSEVKVMYPQASDGEVGTLPALAANIGPLGLSRKEVGEDIAEAMSAWKDLQFTLQLTIQKRQVVVQNRQVIQNRQVVVQNRQVVVQNRQAVPCDHKEINIKQSGNVTLDEIIGIARTMKSKSLSKDLAGNVMEILGTAQSIGCTVNGQPPRDIIDGINSGELEVPDE